MFAGDPIAEMPFSIRNRQDGQDRDNHPEIESAQKILRGLIDRL